MRRFAASALVAGLLAALLLPGNAPGIGVPLVALSVAAAVALAAGIDRDAVLLGGLALALSSMSALRAAEWIVAIDLLGALGLAGLAAPGFATWRGLVAAPLRVLGALGRAPGLIVRPLLPRGRAPRAVLRALGGALAGLALVLVFGALFMSADAAFASIVERFLIPDWSLELLPMRVSVFAVAAMAAGALAGSRPALAPPPSPWASPATVEDGTWSSGRERSTWVTALVLLDLLFLLFVAVQVTFLFGGHDLIQRTTDLTYAEYARDGFFQLLFAAALVLVVIAAAIRWARVRSDADRRLLKALLGTLCVLTLLVLASALRRLSLYEEAFGFTRARLIAHAALLWVGGLLFLIIAAGIRWRAQWLPRACVLLTAVGLLVFSLIDPDGTIAARNVERFDRTGKIDASYLGTLSLDAVPALSRLPVEQRRRILPMFELPSPDAWPGWSAGRSRGRKILARYLAGRYPD